MNRLVAGCFALATIALGCGGGDDTEQEAQGPWECGSASEPRLPVESFDTTEVSRATVTWAQADCSDGTWTLSGIESTLNDETLVEVKASAWDLVTGAKVAEVALTQDSSTWSARASAASTGVACDSREVVWVLQPYAAGGPGEPQGCSAVSDFCGYGMSCFGSCDISACHESADAVGAWLIYPQVDRAYGPFALTSMGDGEFQLSDFDEDLPSDGRSVAFIACSGLEAVGTGAL